MTRKDFALIAASLKATKPIALSGVGQAQKAQWTLMVGEISEALEKTNPAFRAGTFMVACGAAS